MNIKKSHSIILSVTFFIFCFSSFGCEDKVTDSTPIPGAPVLEWRVDGGGAPWGIAIDPQNNIYVSNLLGSIIKKFATSGSSITQWGNNGTGNSQFNWPKYIALDNNINLYVADNMNHRIQKFTSNGTYITQWGSYGFGNGQFNGPCGIAVDKVNGWVYVGDSNNHRIQKFDLTGKFIMQWGRYGSGNGQFNFPEGDVEVDSTGAVYVVDNWNGRIQKFTSDGIYVTKWGTNGSGDGQFLFPWGIAIDNKKGSVYVTDNSTPHNEDGNIARVEEFDLSGNFKDQWRCMMKNGSTYRVANGGIAVDGTGNIYVIQGESIVKYVR